METQEFSTKKIAMNNGLLLGLIGVVIGVIKYVMNWHLEQSPIEMLLSVALTVAILVFSYNQFKKLTGGFMSLGQALKLGMGVILISTLIAVIFNYVLMNIIEPTMLEQMQDIQWEKALEKNPNMTQAQIDAGKEMSAKFSSPAIIGAMQLVAGLFFGFIISLITGLIMKRDNPNA